MKKIQVAETAGFCFGVQRAVEMVERLAREEGPVCTLGPIIHNETVIRRLGEMGVSVISAPAECPPGTKVVIRAHGVPLSVVRVLELCRPPTTIMASADLERRWASSCLITVALHIVSNISRFVHTFFAEIIVLSHSFLLKVV